MIDLRTIVRAAINTINQDIDIVWRRSAGITQDQYYNSTPTTTDSTVKAQVQGLSASDMRHIDSLNIEGVLRSVHMFDNPQGVVRDDVKGGDILLFPEVPGGDVKQWLVVSVMETWPTWGRVIVKMQVSQ